MITATTGLTLNHGWTGGYRFSPPGTPPPRPLPIEWADNTGRVLLYLINDVVEWTNIVWRPMADLLLAGQNDITDIENLTVEVNIGGTVETIVFDQEDEDFYSILASSPTIVEAIYGDENDSAKAGVGWKWNGT